MPRAPHRKSRLKRLADPRAARAAEVKRLLGPYLRNSPARAARLARLTARLELLATIEELIGHTGATERLEEPLVEELLAPLRDPGLPEAIARERRDTLRDLGRAGLWDDPSFQDRVLTDGAKLTRAQVAAVIGIPDDTLKSRRRRRT